MLEKKLRAGIVVKKTYADETYQKNLVDNIVNIIFKYDLDIFLGPEWLFLPKDRLYSKSEKEDIIDELADKTKSRDTLIIPGSMMWYDDKFFYNTAPVISGGKLIKESHKHSDGGSADLADKRDCFKQMYMKPNSCLFNWRGNKSGVEICSDLGHLNEVLKRSNPSSIPEYFLDLYFFVSCGKSLSPSEMPVKRFRYALISDGNVPCAKVLQKEASSLFGVIQPKEEAGRIKIYELYGLS